MKIVAKKNFSLKKSSNIISENTKVSNAQKKKLFFLFFTFLLESNLIRYKCVEINCFESFSRPEQLRAHQISKHSFLVNRFVCYCGQRFKNKTNLKRHEKSEHLDNRKKTEEKVNNKRGINFPGLKMRNKNLLLTQKRLDKSLQ